MSARTAVRGPWEATGPALPAGAALLPAAARWYAALAVAFAVVLVLVDVWRAVLLSPRYMNAGPVLVAAALALPLHLIHVRHALRGERPARSGWTLAALAVVLVASSAIVGSPWQRQLSILATSILLVMRGWRALLLVALVIALPFVLAALPWVAHTPPEAAMPPSYLSLTVAWRGLTHYVPVQLAAAVTRLEATRRELEARTVVQTRLRIDAELRSGVGEALERIVAQGEAARAGVDDDPAAARDRLRLLAAESRRALADARRLVAGYRAPSNAARLDAAEALRAAAGAEYQVDVSRDEQGAVRVTLAPRDAGAA